MNTEPEGEPGYVAQDDKDALAEAHIKGALEKVSLVVVEDHLRGCVLDAVKAGDPADAEEHLAEITNALGRLLKS